MKYALIALTLALSFGPVAVLADDNNAPPQMTQQQRQQLHQTFETYHTQMEQMHKQLRSEVVNSITPAHRQTIAGIIGNLAISANPDPQGAVRQIDTLLSQGEKQRILSLHQSFRTQMKNLHEQMRTQLQKEMPNMPGPPQDEHRMGGDNHAPSQFANDPGAVLLMILSDHKMGDMHHGMFPGGPGRH